MGLAIFITNKDVTERNIKGDENKIKQFPRDIGYKQRVDTKSNRSIIIRKKIASIGERTSQIAPPRMLTTSEDEIYQCDTSDYEQGVVEEEEEEETVYESAEEVKAIGLGRDNLNNLIERLGLLVLETKASYDGLYDQLLKISEQLLSMNINNKYQLDNFVFNYGK